DLSAPNVQYHFAPAYFLEHGFTQPEGHGFTQGPTLLRPESRGFVGLRSRNPAEPSIIQHDFLHDDRDIQELVEGMRLARRIIAAAPFDEYRGEEIQPGPRIESDSDLADYIRSTTEAIYRPVGTCKMGNDPLAVVDSQLKVHQVEGLRVVDASIMPRIVGGNTNAPTIMIAEKAASMIMG